MSLLRTEIAPANGGVQRVAIGGRLDTHTYAELDQALAPLLGNPAVTSLVLDLEGLDYISSAGIRSVFKARKALAARAGKVKPLAVKIAPDLDDEQIGAIAELALKHRIDALIATNTTIGRAGVEGHRHAGEAGGLSGRPVFALSTEVLRKLSRLLAGRIPLIGVGGIHSGADAKAKIDAGASLVQVYTGFIFHGPDLVAEARRALKG